MSEAVFGSKGRGPEKERFLSHFFACANGDSSRQSGMMTVVSFVLRQGDRLMKRPYAPALLGLILLAGSAASQEVPARPTGYPPTPAEAAYRDGFILAKIVHTVQVPETRAGTRTGPDGK